MEATTSRTRLDVLAGELEALGLPPLEAQELSTELYRRAPLARVGIPRLTRELADRGLDAVSAREAAFVLLALDWLRQGAPFGATLDRLREAAPRELDVLPYGLQAARIHRELESWPEVVPRRRRRRERWITLAVAVGGAAWGVLVLELLRILVPG